MDIETEMHKGQGAYRRSHIYLPAETRAVVLNGFGLLLFNIKEII